ncbi:hypothetical protein O1Q96_33175 [Streptomyces sp. Qhu-G9]|nr:hypothetical protein [Streptomyces aurantiacus]WAU84116.1 hypothetical protein O1Q96_33175 [Streptomyces aurantiacus]
MTAAGVDDLADRVLGICRDADVDSAILGLFLAERTVRLVSLGWPDDDS